MFKGLYFKSFSRYNKTTATTESHLLFLKLYKAVLMKIILTSTGQYLKWCQTPKL